jgi:hypothetical protein
VKRINVRGIILSKGLSGVIRLIILFILSNPYTYSLLARNLVLRTLWNKLME